MSRALCVIAAVAGTIVLAYLGHEILAAWCLVLAFAVTM